MIEISLANLVLYSIQVLGIVLAAAVAARLFQIPAPGARLAYWRVVIAASLTWPLLTTARPASGVASPSIPLVTGTASSIIDPAGVAGAGPSVAIMVLWLLAIGVVLRALWIGIGLARLQHLRWHSTPVALDEDLEAMRRGLAPRAQVQSHGAVQQPVTFGWRRPIVLVPQTFVTLAAETQRAVVCHELLHVRRHDWLWMIGEEILRTVFWFHPAMRWALNQVQLSREELVDALAVALTGAKREYMNALLMFSNRAALAPATLFARRNHLAARIRRIAEEVPMSRVRIVITGAALMIVLIVSTWGIVSAVPLTSAVRAAAAQTAPQGVVHTFVAGPPTAKLIVGTQARPEYPPDLLQAGVGATVTLTATLDAAGHVAAFGDPWWELKFDNQNAIGEMSGFWAGSPWLKFIDESKAAARQWRFDPIAGGLTVTMTMTFATGAPPPPPPPPPSAEDLERIYERMRQLAAAAEALGQAKLNSQGVINPVQGSSSPGQLPRNMKFSLLPPPPPPPPPPPSSPMPGFSPLRVGGTTVRPPMMVTKVDPVYPPTARAAGVAGVVILEIRIDREGSVADVRMLRSIPLLDAAAMEAVRQWKYQPVLLNGEPVEVIMAVTVNFTQ